MTGLERAISRELRRFAYEVERLVREDAPRPQPRSQMYVANLLRQAAELGARKSARKKVRNGVRTRSAT